MQAFSSLLYLQADTLTDGPMFRSDADGSLILVAIEGPTPAVHPLQDGARRVAVWRLLKQSILDQKTIAMTGAKSRSQKMRLLSKIFNPDSQARLQP